MEMSFSQIDLLNHSKTGDPWGSPVLFGGFLCVQALKLYSTGLRT